MCNIQTLLVEYVKQLERGLEQLSSETENSYILLIRYRSKERDRKSIRKESCKDVFAGDTGCFLSV